MRQLVHLFNIAYVLMRYDALWFLDETKLAPLLKPFCWLLGGKAKGERPGVRLRMALQALGPTFIKLGQTLSVRADLVGDDVAKDLTQLQDRLPAFSFAKVQTTIEKELGQPLTTLFQSFDEEPVAAASIAQVHFAVDHAGRQLAVKILRPGIEKRFADDIKLFYSIAHLFYRLFPRYRRLKFVKIVDRFAEGCRVEMDLRLEAAAASKLKENLAKDEGVYVPEVYWEFTSQRVMALERISGVRVDDKVAILAAGHDVDRILKHAAEIFFKQVYRDGFFHADMHPGNLFIDTQGRIALVDFGIMGRIDETIRLQLAEVLLGFLDKDYDRVSKVHFDAGWIPAGQNQALFALAARSIGEPIFGKPQNEISIARLLQQLFKISEDFQMETQPQLLLLQKTMMFAEGIGRQLNPQVNFWELARPLMEQWARQHFGVRALVKGKLRELPKLAKRAEAVLLAAEAGATQPKDAPAPVFSGWKVVLISVIVAAVTSYMITRF